MNKKFLTPVILIDHTTPSEAAMEQICTVADQIEWDDVLAGLVDGTIEVVALLAEMVNGEMVLAFTVRQTQTGRVWVTDQESGSTDGMSQEQFANWFGEDTAKRIW